MFHRNCRSSGIGTIAAIVALAATLLWEMVLNNGCISSSCMHSLTSSVDLMGQSSFRPGSNIRSHQEALGKEVRFSCDLNWTLFCIFLSQSL